MDVKETPNTRTSGKAIASLVMGILSFCFSLLTGIPAIILGIIAIGDVDRAPNRVTGKPLAIAGIVLGSCGTLFSCPLLIALLLPAIQAAREAARSTVSIDNMRNIGLSMSQYQDTYRSFPPAGSLDPQHGLGLSWRVRVLPFMEQNALFDQFDFHQPWDSEHNQALIEKMPDVFKSPNHDSSDFTTVYLAVVSNAPRHEVDKLTCFTNVPPFQVRLSEVRDQVQNTVMVVEANSDQAVIWTKPDDWEFDPLDPIRGLGNLRPKAFLALFGDASVRRIRTDVDGDSLRALFTRAGNEHYAPQTLDAAR